MQVLAKEFGKLQRQLMELKAKYENEKKYKELDKKDDAKRQNFVGKGVHVMGKSPSDITNGIIYHYYLCISTFIRGANCGGNIRIAGAAATRQRYTLVQILHSIFIHAQ